MNGNKVTIGRDPKNDIRIDDRWDTVSNLHGEISCSNGQLSFTDHSSNGTVINGQKIQNTTVGIYRGDSIRLANAFNLEWGVIERFFPEMNRPTVTRNVRGESLNEGRRTVQMNAREQGLSGSMTSDTQKGRSTEKFEQQPKRLHEGLPSTDGNNFGVANEYSQSEIDTQLEKWNWGAFFCSWLWGAFNGVLWPLFIIAISGIPYLGQITELCLCVYMGMNGSKMAWRSGKHKSFESFMKSQRTWAIIGVFWFALIIACNVFLLNYTLTLF